MRESSVHNGVDFLANANRLFRHDLMRSHALNRRVASRHFGDDGIVIVGVKPSLVANLPTGFGIERRVIENDFACSPRLEFLRALPVFDDGQHFAVVGASLPIAFKL